MATITAPVTQAEFDLLDPEGRFELLDGEVIEMPYASAAHNFLAGKLERRLGDRLDQHTTGVAIHETEFLIGENRFRPDVSVVLLERWKRIGSAPRPVPEPPHIAVEVVSPSESASVLDRKVAAYLESGVAEVWVLHHETEHMLIYTSDNVRMLHRTAILETPFLPGWFLAMSDLLRKQDGVYF